MPLDHLDHMFDDAVKRVKNGKTIADPYGSLPLASDHHLLKKSWEFFNNRLKRIEDQSGEILETKQMKIESLERRILELVKDKAVYESTGHELDKLEKEFIRSRTKDFEEFKSDAQKLMESFNLERVALEDKIVGLEFALEKEKRNTLDHLFKNEGNEKKWRDRVDGLILAIDKLQSDLLEREKSFQQKLADSTSETAGREAKIDLLRAEVIRRDQTIQEVLEEKAQIKEKIVELEDQILDLKNISIDQDKQIDILKSQLKISEKEKINMKNSWEEEQSEWRELWERNRVMWDENKNLQKKGESI